MGREILLGLSCLALTSVAHAGDQILLADVNPHLTNPPNDWDYSEHGSEKWGELDPAYVRATVGDSRSPVDIKPHDVIGADLLPLDIEPHPQPLLVDMHSDLQLN
jgi:carbonic anhydrase